MAEERCGAVSSQDGGGGQLLLTEQQWEARRWYREQGQGSGGSGGCGGGNRRRCNDSRGPHDGGNRDGGNRDGAANGERDMSKVKCYNYNNMGHFSRSCPEPRRERKGQAHLARAEDQEVLLMAQVCSLSVVTEGEQVKEHVRLNEEIFQARAADRDGTCDSSWFLDTGASNHMTGHRDAFTELDTSIAGSVNLGDGSNVNIRGRGTVMFKCRNGEHRTLMDVYYLPRL